MSTTLSYGYIQPQNGDRGSVWFAALNANITQLNGHAHNGTDSALLTTQSTVVTTQTIVAPWTSIGGGNYQKTVTMPGTLTFDAVGIEFRLSTGEMIYPSVVKASANTYTIILNSNLLSLIAVYTS